MNNNQLDTRAEDLVKNIESGETEGIEAELNKMDPRERLELARAMDRINQEHLKTNSELPDLVLTVDKDAKGNDYLSDMNVSEERHAFSPMRLIGSEHSSTDIYDEPFSERIRHFADNTAKNVEKKLNEDAPVIRDIAGVANGK